MKTLVQKIENNPSCKVIFTDLFDTLVHRTVHPHYTIKLWSKFLIRELGLSISPDELFAIRIDTLVFLSKKHGLTGIELPYGALIEEVYLRLLYTDALVDTPFDIFKQLFEHADYVAETSVQFKNEELISQLYGLKQKGYRIYLVSDFTLSKEVITKILHFHRMSHIFDDIFISCSVSKSKENGILYPYVLEQTRSRPEEVTMIGDNKKSDVENAAKYGIGSIHLKHYPHKLRNKKNLFGNDANNFRKTCSKVQKRCEKSKHPFSEYIIHFYFFTERLYLKTRKGGVKNLFFLAREGLYLKQLFDLYQELNRFSGKNKIQTHYLKASRQSAQQIALRPLHDEDFNKFSKTGGRMSLRQLLTLFFFPEDIKTEITIDLGIDIEKVHSNIFDSKIMTKLRKNNRFIKHYEINRINQKQAFTNYLNAFGANIEHEGMTLVDVGWGGTMQECIYGFLGEEIPVTGYYIGLKAIYNIQPDTKRYGLNFSIYPSHGISDDILKANGQLYEQLLAAPHGSTLGYSMIDDLPNTIEFHEENEKYVFDNHIESLQEYMLLEFEKLFVALRPINYSQEMSQDYMTHMALRNGILMSKNKIEFINNLSKGFYQNVGENKVGLAYDSNQLKVSKIAFLKRFLRSPEKVFRYLVKIKPYMYSKGIYWLSGLVSVAYYYMRFNFWVKKKWFPKSLLKS